MKIADSDYAELRYTNGELGRPKGCVLNRATVPDPVEFRGSKKPEHFSWDPVTQHLSDAIVVIYGAANERPDGNIVSLANIFGKGDERYDMGANGEAGAGCWEFWVRKPNMGSTDAAMQKVMTLEHDGITFHVPVKGIPQAALPKEVALRSHANGKLVCAEADGAEPLIANRDAVGEWETFDLVVVK